MTAVETATRSTRGPKTEAVDLLGLADSGDLPTLKVEEVAQMLGLSKQFIYQQVHSGALTARRFGRHLKITPNDVRGWYASLSTSNPLVTDPDIPKGG